jgi:hypothetical protein
MPEENTTSETLTPPEIPANTFILDPETYHVWSGRLEFKDSPASRKSRRWGYILLVVALMQFVFFILTATSSGSVVLAVLFGLFLGGIGYALLRNGQKHSTWQKSSRIILGELDSIEGRLIDQTLKKKRLTSNLIIATYKFTNPEGVELSGVATFERNDLINRRLPYSGTPVIVLYKTPKKHLMC